MDSNNKKVFIFITAIFIIALGIRIINLEIIKDNPFFNYPIMDEKYHDEWAQEIASGNLFERTPFYRAPGYPYFLGLIYAVFGHSYFIPRLIGIIIGALSCVLIYLIGKEGFSHKIGALASLLACFYGMLIYFDSMLLTVYLEIFFCLVGIYWILRWSKTQKNGHILLAGIFWGLVSIVRPNFLIFAPVFALYVLLHLKKQSLIKRLKTIGLFVCGIAPFIVALMTINVISGKDTVIVAWNGGINLYLGNNSAANGWSATSPELDATWWGGYKDAIVIAQKNTGQKLLPSQVSNYWFKRGFNYILSEPSNWMFLMIRKVYLLFNSYELSNNQSIKTFREFSPFYRIPLLNYGFIITFAIWGMIAAVKKRKTILIMLFLLSYSFSIVLFFVPARYRMPLVPFLLIFAASAVFWIAEKIKTKDYKQLGLAAVVVFGLTIFVHTDFYGTHRDIVNKSEVYATYGNQYYTSGRYKEAVEAYKKSLKFNPKNVSALNALGDTYLMLNRQNDAIRMYKQSAKIEKNVDAFCKLGIIDFQNGRFDSAKTYFSIALELDATNPEVYYYTGMLYAFTKEPDLAIENLELSLRYYPDPKYISNINYNLGKLYLETGNLEKAKQYLLKVGTDYKDVSEILKHIK